MFHELQVWEDDWIDYHVEDFDLKGMAVPPSCWYCGDVKSMTPPCPCPLDPYSGWKVDLYLKAIAILMNASAPRKDEEVQYDKEFSFAAHIPVVLRRSSG